MDGLISRVLSLGAPRQPAEVGHASAYGRQAVEHLAAQRRVFDRLDWWSVGEWVDSDAFVAVGRDRSMDGALLAVPVALDDPNCLPSNRSDCAWLRWCALADGVSGSEAMRLLLDRSAAELRRAGVRRLYAILETTHWIAPYLRDAGFAWVDDVITLQVRCVTRRAQQTAPVPGLRFRPADRPDLPAVAQADASAFDEVWRFSNPVLARALGAASCFRVAEQDGAVVGYSCAVSVEDEAHVTRIAVRADRQRRGIGAALLEDTLARLESEWGARVVTLNTQASNLVSRRLYRRFGFQEIGPVMRVLRRQLAP